MNDNFAYELQELLAERSRIPAALLTNLSSRRLQILNSGAVKGLAQRAETRASVIYDALNGTVPEQTVLDRLCSALGVSDDERNRVMRAASYHEEAAQQQEAPEEKSVPTPAKPMTGSKRAAKKKAPRPVVTSPEIAELDDAKRLEQASTYINAATIPATTKGKTPQQFNIVARHLIELLNLSPQEIHQRYIDLTRDAGVKGVMDTRSYFDLDRNHVPASGSAIELIEAVVLTTQDKIIALGGERVATLLANTLRDTLGLCIAEQLTEKRDNASNNKGVSDYSKNLYMFISAANTHGTFSPKALKKMNGLVAYKDSAFNKVMENHTDKTALELFRDVIARGNIHSILVSGAMIASHADASPINLENTVRDILNGKNNNMPRNPNIAAELVRTASQLVYEHLCWGAEHEKAEAMTNRFSQALYDKLHDTFAGKRHRGYDSQTLFEGSYKKFCKAAPIIPPDTAGKSKGASRNR